MKLFIKTPFVDDNKFIPHLVEHCLLQTRDASEYLRYSLSTTARTGTGLTCFEWDDIPLEEFFSYLEAPIKKEIFEQESISIEKELKNPSFGQKVYEKTLCQISHRKIITNKPQKIGLEQLETYHKKRHKEENTVLINENGEISKTWGIGKQLRSSKLDIKNTNIIYADSFSYQKELQNFLWTEYNGIEDIFVLDYIGDLISSYWQYQSTLKSTYFYNNFDWSFGDKYLILSVSGDLDQIKKSDFYDFFPIHKEDFLTKLELGWYRTRDSQIALFMQLETSIEEHKKLIESIDNQLIESVLSVFLKEKLV